MHSYTLVFARSARKDIQGLSLVVAESILKKIELLSTNPRPVGCKKLHGFLNLWRIRVGEYHVIYSIDDGNQIVDISVIRHRSDAYR